jgi:hypothetical protein
VAVLTTLKGTRDRVRQEHRPPAITPAPPPGEVEKPADDLAAALGGAKEIDRPVVAPPAAKIAGASSEADYTGRLLRAKRRAREDLESQDESGNPPPG